MLFIQYIFYTILYLIGEADWFRLPFLLGAGEDGELCGKCLLLWLLEC